MLFTPFIEDMNDYNKMMGEADSWEAECSSGPDIIPDQAHVSTPVFKSRKEQDEFNTAYAKRIKKALEEDKKKRKDRRKG